MSNIEFTPYQYSIVRYHHDSTTHEFLNIGVVLFCADFNYLRAKVNPESKRITATFFSVNSKEYSEYVHKINQSFKKLSKEIAGSTKIPDQNIESLIRKYLRQESSFQYSDPSSGIAPASIEGLDETFDHIYYTYVNKYTIS